MKLFGTKRAQRPPDTPGKKPRRRALFLVPLALAAAALISAAVLGALLRRLDPAVPFQAEVGPAVNTPSLLATPPPGDPPPEPREEAGEPPDAGQARGGGREKAVRAEGMETFALMVLARGGNNIDSFFLGRLNRTEGRLDLVSLPRDTLVNVPWEVKKLTTVYAFSESGGAETLDRLAGLTGFRADHYLVLTEDALAQVLDALGGVAFNVPVDMDYDDPDQDLHIHVRSGYRVLTGAECVQYLRFRTGNDGGGYPDGDLGRLSAQHRLLAALASQLLDRGGTAELERVIPLLLRLAETDLSPEALDAFAVSFGELTAEQVFFHTAPGSVVSIRGGSYYQLEPKDWAEMLNEALNPLAAPLRESDLDVLREFGEDGAISTSGRTVPLTDFFDYYSYAG